MLLKPQPEDFRVIRYYLGRMALGIGLAMLLPLAAALWFREWNAALDFVSGIGASAAAGFLLAARRPRRLDLNWANGIIIAALSWLLAMCLGALPLYLSGHFASPLDALFEAMSGFSTTGLSLVRDLDRLAHAYNLWRHLTQFLGGQGIIVVALTFFIRGISGGFSLYIGEARDEKILPNVISTARFIWLVTLVYLVLGTAVLTVLGLRLGIAPARAFFHALCLFMAAWDTGGFTTQSQSILYFHSAAYETATFFIFFLGSLNFGLHYLIWSGRRAAMWRDAEIRTYLATIVLVTLLTLFGLARGGPAAGAPALFRAGFYQALSAHTGTGFMTVPAVRLAGWSELALLGLVLAMAAGGCVSSTAGAIKALRISIVAKGFWRQMKRVLTPEQGMVAERIHHFRTITLEDGQVQAAALIVIAYIGLYLLGAMVGAWYGYSFLPALFESVSAAANVGLSVGITEPGMPVLLKIVYIFQMWVGRFEFMAVFVLAGFIISWFRGR